MTIYTSSLGDDRHYQYNCNGILLKDNYRKHLYHNQMVARIMKEAKW